jgi:hypothetical protein
MVRNFLNFDRTWCKDEPESDALGRVLWALGTVVAKPPILSYLSIVKDCFDRAVKHAAGGHPRVMAQSILGMADYLKQFPGAGDIKRQLAIAADGLIALYEENSHPDWQWFLEELTYENAVLPHALFVAGLVFKETKYIEIAEKSCKFLLAKTFNGTNFSFAGCNGWYRRGGAKAAFDQQPVEAASTVMMLRAAYDATGNSRFLTLQRKAFEWFIGENDLYISVYDFRTKGCCDALMSGGVNLNQGAESMVSFLLSLLAIVESYAVVDKINRSTDVLLKNSPLQGAEIKGQKVGKPTSIEIISADTET